MRVKRLTAIVITAVLTLALIGSSYAADHKQQEAAGVAEPIDTVELVVVQQPVQAAETTE